MSADSAAAKYQVVVVGGGTGTHTVLRGLKKYHDTLSLTAIVTMADSGGSTGRLRDEFGYLPVGDARMALAALAADVDDHEQLVRELFLYRFAKGGGLSGHNFGNLLLTALTDLLGSEVAAIEAASRILRVRGAVHPVTTDDVHLLATYDDGEIATGESQIDEPDTSRWPHRITSLCVTPTADINAKAADALRTADLIVFGPGDLYTSILANCVVNGFAETVQDATARTVFVSNLMTKAGQTTGMNTTDHVEAIAQVLGRSIDHVLQNNDPLPEHLLAKYASEHEFPVTYDGTLTDPTTVHQCGLLSHEQVETAAGDVVRRSLIRHDPDRLAEALHNLLSQNFK
jgi:uncharacterized cofD-like protein